MKVLGLVHQYVPVRNAGAETMVHAMLSALARRGHDVHVSLSMQTGDPYTIDGVTVWPRAGHKPNYMAHLPADVLVAHLENSEPAAYLGRYNDIPVVTVHHNTFAPAKKLLHFPMARVDMVVVNSQWMADDLAAWCRAVGGAQPRTIIVRPLVDRAHYATTPGDRVTLVNLKRQTRDPGSSLVFGKGSETFWALAERMPRTRFLGVSGAYGEQQAGELPNVEIMAHTANMRDDVYARTRVLLVPSNYESWGRVASEAICSGIPVIAHPTPGLVENLGDAGIFVDWQDVDGYVRELRRLARPAAWAKASAAALARAGEHQLMRVADEDVWVSAIESLIRAPAMVR